MGKYRDSSILKAPALVFILKALTQVLKCFIFFIYGYELILRKIKEIKMGRIDERLKYKTNPLSDERAIIKGDKYRFTVLTDRLIRIEYDEEGLFTDLASEAVIDRHFEVPHFEVEKNEKYLKITTDYMELKYTYGKFAENTLYVDFCGKYGSIRRNWRFGTPSKGFEGAYRTLDGCDGSYHCYSGTEIELTKGVVSNKEIVIMDDDETVLIGEDGWIEERKNKVVDKYIFAYLDDFYGAMDAYHKLTGKTPLLPKYALSNWWSRYYAYTDESYRELMNKFKKKKIPFNVAVIDMDWHLVKIDSKYGSGWTGYTWNKELFPDPKDFMDFLHNNNMAVTLNVHPAEGVAAHEDAYEKIAERMGVDPKTEKKVDFDIANPKFLSPYLECLHHKNEEDGVDFWWIDWQQGKITAMPSLDPLFALNHYHTIDNARNGKRPLVLSRFSGYGSHRYPVGFSGDTVVSWKSLKYQCAFTVKGANIGYDWWSHDIGGHMLGKKDDELTVRWLQFGVFSPINRLHSTCNEFVGKEPWNYGMEAEKVMCDFLKLRYKLIPYLYTMNYLTHTKNIALVRPLYFDNPKDANSYDAEFQNEYYFGTELLVMPITSKIDSDTKMACEKTYLPEGVWFDYFSHRLYNGKRRVNIHRTLETIPVFAKAGAIIPSSYIGEDVNGLENPEKLKIEVFAGADNSFELYEDDGETMQYEQGKFAVTKMNLKFGGKTFEIEKTGDLSLIPGTRTYVMEFVRFADTDVSVIADGKNADFKKSFDGDKITVEITTDAKKIEVKFEKCNIVKNNCEKDVFDFLMAAQVGTEDKAAAYSIVKSNDSTEAKISNILTMTKHNFCNESLPQSAKGVIIEYLICDK